MQTVNEKIHDLIVTENTELRGIATDSVIVKPGYKLILKGIIAGNLIIENEAIAVIHGIVNGSIIVKEKGRLEVFGILNGDIKPEKDSIVTIDTKAIVNN